MQKAGEWKEDGTVSRRYLMFFTVVLGGVTGKVEEKPFCQREKILGGFYIFSMSSSKADCRNQKHTSDSLSCLSESIGD